MLVQTPSKIFKSDFAVWKDENSCRIRKILTEEKDLNLRKVTEIVFDQGGKYRFEYKANCNLMILVLYGEILINDFNKQISAHEVFTLKSTETDFLSLKNNLEEEKADVLIVELESKNNDNSFLIKDLNIDLRNSLIQIAEDFDYPNFIGLYDGRKEDTYIFYKSQKSVFGMVINGAFEFQNRMLETRDAILLSEIETLEFEALSENALILLLEI
ncbi:hypothetical protein ODZ84_22910 [Chryseobacterium fluminis]|uniref:pirin family protein n=1 Tax=Chryseobacterium fluminis TaxID=2983606 RepID=UPI0022598D85|nr:hypothetical protein [Chryseobacterium sp. MMS21-Ot14]UZT97978.1 hypothetical protein ODZ84_22910 [Chryseobacterium sp. MMS21-Ot14]